MSIQTEWLTVFSHCCGIRRSCFNGPKLLGIVSVQIGSCNLVILLRQGPKPNFHLAYEGSIVLVFTEQWCLNLDFIYHPSQRPNIPRECARVFRKLEFRSCILSMSLGVFLWVRDMESMPKINNRHFASSTLPFQLV